MTRYNLALLSLLASTAYAVPHYNQHGHKHPVHHKSSPQPSGVVSSGSGFVPTGGPTAPYGLANSTVAGPTDTAPVTSKPIITSVVTVVPEPEPTTAQESSIESSVNNFPVGGSSAAEECGPATVTVTKVDTITVTVSANSVESPNETTSAADGESTSTIVSESSSSDVHESPSVTQPGPLESSSSAASPENAFTSSAETGESYEAPETPEAAESSTEESIEEEPAKEEPAAEESAEESAEEEPATKVPTVEQPTVEEPTEEEPTSGDSRPTPRAPSTDNVVARGLVYNKASLTSAFSNANVGWMYNWNSAPGGQIDSSKEFVPMLWNTSQVFHVPHWEERAEAAIAAGSKHLLAFNEPDLPAQANMDVDQSVAGWMDYMEPFHAKHNGAVKLGSPSVCNGPEKHLGLSYLSDFLASCGGCHVDFIAIHWYGLANDDGVGHLKEHIAKAQEVAAGRPIWLTEFKPDGSDEQQAEFLGKILPWLDDKSNGVDRYAYFMVDNMVNGASLTQAGSAYAA